MSAGADHFGSGFDQLRPLMGALSGQVDVGGVRQWAGFRPAARRRPACGLVAYEVNHLVDLATASYLLRALGLAAAIGASVPVYFAFASVLRLEESADAWRMVRRRIPGLA